MNATFERLRTAMYKLERLTCTVSHVKRFESGTVLGVYYEGAYIVIPADELKLPERLIGVDVDFIVMAISPYANMAAGCFARRKGESV